MLLFQVQKPLYILNGTRLPNILINYISHQANGTVIKLI